MSLRHRLEQLEKTGCMRFEVPRAAPTDLGDVLPGEVVANEYGTFYLYRERHSCGDRYGPRRLSDARGFPAQWLDHLGVRHMEPARAVFLDTETTGLSGGSGTYAFLVGLAWFEDQHLVLEQLFMREHSEERALLAYLLPILEQSGGLVTFNGKTFDLQLLQTRFLMNRMRTDLDQLAHLDLLHPCRRIWGPGLPDCRLETLETRVLGLPRHDDTPGFMVPELYFRYLRTRDARPLKGIAEHNQRDLFSLVGLLALLGERLVRPTARATPAEDYALGRFLVDAGDEATGRFLLERAVAGALPPRCRRAAFLLLAHLRRRADDRRGAADLWKRVLAEHPYDPEAVEELAKHLEHRVGDYQRALGLVETILEAPLLSPGRRRRFERRRLRLQCRLKVC